MSQSISTHIGKYTNWIHTTMSLTTDYYIVMSLCRLNRRMCSIELKTRVCPFKACNLDKQIWISSSMQTVSFHIVWPNSVVQATKAFQFCPHTKIFIATPVLWQMCNFHLDSNIWLECGNDPGFSLLHRVVGLHREPDNISDPTDVRGENCTWNTSIIVCLFIFMLQCLLVFIKNVSERKRYCL